MVKLSLMDLLNHIGDDKDIEVTFKDICSIRSTTYALMWHPIVAQLINLTI